jgi:WD40 repeat protein
VDGTVRLWDARSGQPRSVLRGHAGLVYGVALSRDGQLVASSGVDGTVRLWLTTSGACVRILRDDRRFERVDITGLTGVTEAQWRALLALGAREIRQEADLPPTDWGHASSSTSGPSN